MTEDLSTNARFVYNGDIDDCDTGVTMFNIATGWDIDTVSTSSSMKDGSGSQESVPSQTCQAPRHKEQMNNTVAPEPATPSAVGESKYDEKLISGQPLASLSSHISHEEGQDEPPTKHQHLLRCSSAVNEEFCSMSDSNVDENALERVKANDDLSSTVIISSHSCKSIEYDVTGSSSNDDVIDPSRVETDNDNLLKDDNANSIKDSSSKDSATGHVSANFCYIPQDGASTTSGGISSQSDDSSLSFNLRGTGWGSRRATLGLHGGGELSNGTSAWGPPPPGGSGAGTSGWGAPPPPNPTAAAAWGAPNNASNQMSSDEPSNNATKAPGTAAPPSPQGNASQQQPSAPGQPAQTTTSWAAAAGKGLPPSTEPSPAANGSNNNSATTNGSSSKQLEQLNSVREALFSQDGWGGSHVKQDSAWNVDGMDVHGKEQSVSPWSNTTVPRNDGTELWKSTLSGQPPVSKPQPSSPWHAPQNPTDYKQWGEEEDSGGSSNAGAVGARDNLWNADQSFNAPQQKPKEDWSSSGWSDQRRDPVRGDSLSQRPDPGTWNAPGAPGAPRHPSNWNLAGPAPVGRGSDWGESPTMARRAPYDDGTSLWGNKQAPAAGAPPGVSNWKDMPTPNVHQLRGPPGPPGPRMPPVQDPSPWNPRGWSADSTDAPMVGGGWGGDVADPVKRDLTSWGDPQWSVGGGARPRMPPNPMSNQRGSPGWDDPLADSWSAGGMKPLGQKKISFEAIRGSKQFRALVERGFRIEDVELTLKASNGNFEEALEILRTRDQGGMYGQDSNNFFDQSRARFPGMVYPPDPSLNYKLGMSNSLSQPRQPAQTAQPPASQPSAQQLRILVQQIQMAVQAGHLNAQILNQPLAPQTLLSLNHLLQQIKTLQTLQQQHTLAQSQKPMGGNTNLMAISVNITKTKQNIQNLQNQISAQQAAYLKSQQLPPAGPPHQSLGGNSFDQGVPDFFGNFGGQSAAPAESHLPVNKSRLNLWKLPDENSAFSKAPGASSAKPFDDSPWTPNSSGTTGGWPDSGKSECVSNGLDSFGIPEFEPGKPWKGPGMKNPDEDPNLTPGSMAQVDINTLSKAASNLNLQSTSSENTLGLTSSTWSFGGSTTDLKSSSTKVDGWNGTGASSSNLTPMGQDLWGKSGRVPGNEGGSGWPSSNGWNGSQNGDNSMMNGSSGPCWLLLKNLTPQIDGSTLKTLCIQHGPLKQFHLFLSHSIALVLYATGREAQKAQKALNNCLLGNTTIHASSATDSEAASILQQLGGGSATPGGGPQLAVTSTPSRGNTPNSANLSTQVKTSSSAGDMWPTSGSLFSGSGSVWSAAGADLMDSQQRTTPQLQPYLPGDLLGENM